MDQELRLFLEEWVGRGEVTAAAALVGTSRGVERTAWAGVARLDPPRPVQAGSRFDLASLTKTCTATLALALHRLDLVPLSMPVGAVWPHAGGELAECTLEDLLRHRAGLQRWAPLYRRCTDPRRVAGLLLSTPMAGERAGTYSDLDYILWGLSVEKILQRPLRRLMRRHLALPLGAETLAAGAAVPKGVVECRLDNAREVELAAGLNIRVGAAPPPPRGIVQDGNARFLGGLGGHAGLFGAAEDLWRVGREWLRPGGVLNGTLVERALEGSGRWRLGWEEEGGSFSHAGFTGGKIRIQPAADRVTVVLAHRTSVDVDLAPWHARFHQLAAG